MGSWLSINGGGVFADIRLDQISGERGLGVFLLEFRYEFRLNASRGQRMRMLNLTADVKATRGKSNVLIGRAVPSRGFDLETTEAERAKSVALAIELSRDQV